MRRRDLGLSLSLSLAQPRLVVQVHVRAALRLQRLSLCQMSLLLHLPWYPWSGRTRDAITNSRLRWRWRWSHQSVSLRLSHFSPLLLLSGALLFLSTDLRLYLLVPSATHGRLRRRRFRHGRPV